MKVLLLPYAACSLFIAGVSYGAALEYNEGWKRSALNMLFAFTAGVLWPVFVVMLFVSVLLRKKRRNP